MNIAMTGKRWAAAMLAACSLACADQLEYTAYYFGDNTENTVATTSFSLSKTLFRRTLVLLDIELDQVTLPPVSGGTGVDGVSSASRPARQNNREFRKNRGQIIAGVEQGWGDDTQIAGNYYNSQELDYHSQSFVGTLTRSLLQKNFTLSLRGQYTLDSVGEILASGALFNRFKEIHQGSLTLTQLLSPTTVLRLGGDGSRYHGFLSDPYRMVRIPDPANPPGTRLVRESHPTMRFRQAAWTELSRYFRDIDASLLLNYRYYWDDWNLTSHTMHIKASKYVGRNWILSPEYRYYDQTAADFGTYGGEYHTGDYKLAAHTSNFAGVGLTCLLRAFSKKYPDWDFLGNSSVSFMYFRYFNSLDFQANVLETRLKFPF